MKKTISIISLLLILSLSFNVNAQTYNIIGTWEEFAIKDSHDLKIYCSYTFNANNSGIVKFRGNIFNEFQDFQNFKTKISLKGDCSFSWDLDGSKINILFDDSKFNITEQNIDFLCNDPQIQAILDSNPQLIEKQNHLSKGIISSLKDIILYNNHHSQTQWNILDIEDKNTLIIIEEDSIRRITRIE